MVRLRAIVLAALVLMLAPLAARAGDTVTPAEAEALVRSHAAVLVDVRTPMEWAETGVPAGAKLATWGRADFLDAMLAAVDGDRYAPVILICRTGNRTARALAVLREHGFTRVTHVAEGMNGSPAGPGWLARGLPVTPWRLN